MKVALLISMILVLSIAFKLERSQQPDIQSSDYKIGGNLKACWTNQTNTVFGALAACDSLDASQSVKCMNSYIEAKLHQKWNIFLNEKNGTSQLSYWIYDDCSIALNNYGKYNRTYTFWSAYEYQVESKESESLQSTKTLPGCPQWQYSAVNSTLSPCDFSDNYETARCIKRQMKDIHNQYWNVIVSRDAYYGIQFWEIDGCYISYNNVGSYKRAILVWKMG